MIDPDVACPDGRGLLSQVGKISEVARRRLPQNSV
jgi:hypothetical protein